MKAWRSRESAWKVVRRRGLCSAAETAEARRVEDLRDGEDGERSRSEGGDFWKGRDPEVSPAHRAWSRAMSRSTSEEERNRLREAWAVFELHHYTDEMPLSNLGEQTWLRLANADTEAERLIII